MAQWAAKNGIKKVVTLVSDYGPGIDAEKAFKEAFTKDGGEVSPSCACRCATRISRPSCSA